VPRLTPVRALRLSVFIRVYPRKPDVPATRAKTAAAARCWATGL
jgi:hypothetical protein